MDMQVGVIGFKDQVTYSPWMARPAGATSVAAAVLVVDMAGTAPDIKVEVLTRNDEDTDSGSVVGAIPSSGTISTTGVHLNDSINDIEEQVRFRYTIGGTKEGDWVHWTMLTPQFYSKKS